jgi:hypothetical protein
VIMLEPGRSVICDVTIEFFQSLPKVQIRAHLLERSKPVRMPTNAA